MGTFLKYVFYVIVIVVVYLIGRGIYEGSITEKLLSGKLSAMSEPEAKSWLKTVLTRRRRVLTIWIPELLPKRPVMPDKVRRIMPRKHLPMPGKQPKTVRRVRKRALRKVRVI